MGQKGFNKIILNKKSELQEAISIMSYWLEGCNDKSIYIS